MRCYYDTCIGTVGTWMQFPLYQRKILIGALLFCLLIITFCIRIQGTGHLSNLQFTGNDAYLYHWQAGIISEHGRLPARDMHRWLPLGRDNGQLLSLYAYAIQGYLVLRIIS